MSDQTNLESLNRLLGRVCRLHHARIHEGFEGLGLYRGQPPVLHFLWEQDGMTHSELAERLHVTPSTITKMINRMEKSGFVERRADAKDHRVSRVYLTDEGRAVQGEVKEVWRAIESETFEGFTLEERVLLRRFLMQIRDNLTSVTGDEHGHHC